MFTKAGTSIILCHHYVVAPLGGTSANACLQELGIRIVTNEVAMGAQKIPA